MEQARKTYQNDGAFELINTLYSIAQGSKEQFAQVATKMSKDPYLLEALVSKAHAIATKPVWRETCRSRLDDQTLITNLSRELTEYRELIRNAF